MGQKMSSLAQVIRQSRKAANSEPDAVCDLEINFRVKQRFAQETADLITEYGDYDEMGLEAKLRNGIRTARFRVEMEGPARLIHEFLLDLNVVISQ